MKHTYLFLMVMLAYLGVGAQCACDPPQNLSSTLHEPHWTDVKLDWEYPTCMNAINHALTYAGTEYANSIGVSATAPCDIKVAHRYTSSDLAPYHGTHLRYISFMPCEASAVYSLQVWQGGSLVNNVADPGSLIVDQPISETLGMKLLNRIELSTPIVIDSTQELWIGFRAVTPQGYPAGVTSSPAVAGKGDLYTLGSSWNMLSSSTDLSNYNWIILGHVYSDISDIDGFKVYRDNVLLATLPATRNSYEEILAQPGTYSYAVSTVWANQCESPKSTTSVVMTQDPCLLGIDVLPYQENFDFYTSGILSMPDCWERITTQENRPYISNTYSSSSSNSLYFYSTASSYNIAVLPRLDDYFDMNSLQVKLKLYKVNTADKIDIGIMTDPEDITTFEVIETLSPQTTARWEEFTVYLNEYEGIGRYLAFRSQTTTTNYMYIDDLEIDEIPACIPPSGLEVSSVAGNSALVSWIPSTVTESDFYYVEVSEQGQNQWVSYTSYGNNHILTGLSDTTWYDVRVAGSCGSDISPYITASFRTICSNGGNVEVGNGTTTSYLLPLNNYYRYTLSQQIFLSSEMNGATELEGISFDYAYSQPTTSKTNVSIYLGHTHKTLFTSNADWIDTSSLTLVYTGNLNCTQGWNDFLFDTPFQYNGQDNLVLVVDDNSNQYDGTTYTFYTHSTGRNSTLYNYSDSYNADINNLPPTGGSSTLSTSRSNVKFIASCDPVQGCMIPNLIATNVTHESVDVSWVPAGTEMEWDFQYRSDTDTGWTELGPLFVTHYSFNDLHSNTVYHFRVKAICYPEESEWRSVTIRTECGDMGFPWTENFDAYGFGAPNYPLPFCWVRNPSGSTYPYISNSYSQSSPASLYMYSTASTYSIAVLPKISDETLVSDLQMTLSLYKTGTDYDIQIGVMTDPEVDTTFHLIRRISPLQLNIWEEFTVYFNQYTGNGKYIALKSDRQSAGAANTIYVDNIEIDRVPVCSAPGNLTVSYTGGTSALATWTPGIFGTLVDYVVEISEAGQNNWISDITTENYYIITGLTELGEYDIRVKTNCEEDESGFAYFTFQTQCILGGEKKIGNGTNTSYEIPVCNFYNYSLTQQIFLASEIGGPTDIREISFQYAYTSPTTVKNNVSIYLGHTSKTTFNSASDWVPIDSLTLVYTGNVNCTQGWNAFTLDTAFSYNGLDNLVLVVDDNSGSYNSSLSTFNTHSTANNMTIYYRSDGSNPDINTPPSATSYTLKQRNNIIFGSDCETVYTCAPPNLMIYNIGYSGADLAWVSEGTETMWSLEYKSETDSVWTSLGIVTDNSYPLTGLLSHTAYSVRLRAICSPVDSSVAVIRSFNTECGYIDILPRTENFDTYGANSPSYPIPTCWDRNSTYNTNSPYISTSYYLSSPSSMYLYATSTNYSLIAMEELSPTLNANEVEASFQIRTTAYNNAIDVGVMEDPQDISTFTLIERLTPPVGTWTHYSVPFNSYTGDGKFIVFKSDGRVNGATNTVYLDDVVLDHAPQCPRPLYINLGDISADGALVTWNEVNGVSGYDLVAGSPGFDPNTATPYSTTDTFYNFAGTLIPNTHYEVYVRTNCDGYNYSGWSYVLDFWTGCDPVTISDLPYTENFDTWGTGTITYPIPNCWTKLSSYSTTIPYPYITTTNYSSPGSLYFYGSSTTYTIGVLPEFDVTVQPDNLYLNFRMYSSNLSSGLDIGFMTDPTDPATFVSVATVMPSVTSIWEEMEVYTHTYTGSGTYLAFKHTGSTSGVYLDNLMIDIAPTCRRPENLTVSNVTASSAEIDWNEYGTATQWEIEYGSPANFTPGSGTIVIANSKPFTLTGLTDATPYGIYVRAICTPGDTSRRSDANSFETPCLGTISLPYTQDFDSYSGTGYNSAGPIPSCWYTTTDNTTYPAPHIVRSGNTYAYVNSAPNSLSMTSGGAGANSYAVLPEFNAAFSSLKLYFNYQMESSTSGTLYVGYIETNQDNIASFQSLKTITSRSGSMGRDSVIMSDYTIPAAAKYIAFYWQYSSSYYTVCIDDILVEAGIPPYDVCNPPVNLAVPAATLTSTSAQVTWSPGGNETAWSLEYKKSSDANYTIVSVTNPSPSTLSGLTPLTQYNVRMKSLCDAGEESEYEYVNFTTHSDEVQYFTITATSGPNGTISPSGDIQVVAGEDRSFTITPNPGCDIEDIWVDNQSVGTHDVYTFFNVRANHTIEVRFTLGIDENSVQNGLILYPNPAHTWLTIETQIPFNRMEITNLLGQVIYSGTVGGETLQIDISGYENGLYFLRMYGNSGSITKKFVKQ